MSTTLMIEVARNLLAAWAAGLLVGAERTYNGRAAGFRTHALVSLAAAAVATISILPVAAPGLYGAGLPRLDPSRLVQGVMTGIGFLGAGVIFKEGINVQGLTTAASIWAISAVGLMFGLGLLGPASLATAVILVTLLIMRWVEDRLPWRAYATAVFRFRVAEAPSEAGLRTLLGSDTVYLQDFGYRLIQGGTLLEYSVNLRTRRRDALARLAEQMRTVPGLVEYDLFRTNA